MSYSSALAGISPSLGEELWGLLVVATVVTAGTTRAVGTKLQL
jgi:hypothetical protein